MKHLVCDFRGLNQDVRTEADHAAPQTRFGKVLLSVLAAIAISCVFSIRAHAQIDQGAVTGTVQDDSGAVISGASVTLTNTGTGLQLHTQSDEKGLYTFSPVRIGNYEISVTAPGFEKTTQEHVHVDLQQTSNVRIKLTIGNVEQTVTVTDAPPLLETQQSSVGQVVSTQSINNTPLNGRNWVYIAQLTSGVVPSLNSRGTGNGDFAANGQIAYQNNFVLDGIDNNMYGISFTNHATFALQPPPDALAEFKVQTSNYSAVLGHSAGAVVNTSIKSGTNDIHGSLWEYVRNTAFDARDFNALTIPAYHQNQFGATLGLPIKKNGLFFFGYAEANRISQGQTATVSVPTPLMRQGNFTELLNTNLTGAAQPITLYQPGSAGTQPVACNGQNNVFCAAQLNPIAQNLINLYPMPNTNNGKTYANYVVNTPATYDSWQWGPRVDWNISGKDQAFARFSYLHIPQNYPAPLGPVLDGGNVNLADGPSSILAENFAANETHIFTPSFSNVLGIGRVYTHNAFLQQNANNPDLSASAGLGGIPPGQFNGGLPYVSVGGMQHFGAQTYLPNDGWSNVYVIQDDVTKIIRNQTLKFGGLLQSIRFSGLQPPASRGTYDYSGFFSSNPGKAFTGYGVADFLLDQMNFANVSNSFKGIYSRWYRAAYFEDTWRATPKLTLNLGARYEYFQPNKEVGGYQGGFLVTGPIAPGSGQGTYTLPNQQRNTYLSPRFLGLLSQSNVTLQYSGNQYLTNAQQLNISPRLGFAFTPTDKTVVSGGFGIFYGGLENIGGAPLLYNNYPFQFTSNFPRPKVCQPGNCAANGITLANGFSAQLAGGVANLGNYIATPTFQGVQSELRTPYTKSYNISVQQELTPNVVATIGYVGNVNRHNPVYVNLNDPDALTDPRLNSQAAKPFPLLQNLQLSENEGISNYNSLQTKLEKRYSNGLNFLGSYTWAHSMDDTSIPLGGGTPYRNFNLIGITSDYTNSSFDVRHRLTLNTFYELPFGKGHAHLNDAGRLVEALAGGWATDLVFVAQTGEPFSVATNLGGAGPNGAGSNAILIRDPFAPGGTPPPSNPNVSCAAQTRTRLHWYNPCALANPPLAFPGASVPGSPTSTMKIGGLAALPYLGGRYNTVYGPGYERINMSMFKNLHTFRSQFLQVRVDIFNVLNTPAYGQPSISNNSSSGGLITTPIFFQNFSPDARFFQLSAKYEF